MMFGRITHSTIFFVFCPLLIFSQEVEQDPRVYKFLENKGQWPSHVNFKADVPGGNIWLEESRIIYHFYQRDDFHHHLKEDLKEFKPEVKEHLIFAKFLNTNDEADLEKLAACNEYYNYFIGNDRTKWATNVK